MSDPSTPAEQAPAEHAPVAGALAAPALTARERESIWVGMVLPEGPKGEPNANLDGVLNAAMPGVVAAVEKVLADRLAWLTEDRDTWQRLAGEHAATAEARMQRIGALLRERDNTPKDGTDR